jgi:hypothetical protein
MEDGSYVAGGRGVMGTVFSVPRRLLGGLGGVAKHVVDGAFNDDGRIADLWVEFLMSQVGEMVLTLQRRYTYRRLYDAQ